MADTTHPVEGSVDQRRLSADYRWSVHCQFVRRHCLCSESSRYHIYVGVEFRIKFSCMHIQNTTLINIATIIIIPFLSDKISAPAIGNPNIFSGK